MNTVSVAPPVYNSLPVLIIIFLLVMIIIVVAVVVANFRTLKWTKESAKRLETIEQLLKKQM